MKIVQFIYSLGNGGAEKFCVELSNEIVKSNVVKIYSYKKVEDWMAPPKKLNKKINLFELNLKKYSLRGFSHIYRIIKTEKPDTIHIHSSLLFFHFFLMVFLFKKIIFIHTIHTTFTPRHKKLFDLLSKIRFAHENLHHVCVSSAIRDEYKKRYPKLKFHHIDNGIAPMHTTKLLPAVNKELREIKGDNEYLFLAIGNYSTYKNFTMLVGAIKKLNLEGFKISLIILGEDQSENKEQWSLVKEKKDSYSYQLGLKGNVADYLYYCDALVMSSIIEGMPLAILEAMSMGKPIISTPAGGVIDMVDTGINGVLTRGFDEKCLIDSIREYLKYDSEKKESIKQGNKKKYITHYSMELCARKYMQLYGENYD